MSRIAKKIRLKRLHRVRSERMRGREALLVLFNPISGCEIDGRWDFEKHSL